MTQIDVWEQTASELDVVDRVLFWADKMSTMCEYLNMETRVKSLQTLFSLMEEVCGKYNEARINIKKDK